MTKKRIHELAKEHGLVGKDLATKLRDLGFSHIKSHMTALDEFEVLQVQAVLEAHGIISSTSAAPARTASAATDPAAGGLIVRRKKKKATAGGADEPADEEEGPEVGEAPPEPPRAASVEAAERVEVEEEELPALEIAPAVRTAPAAARTETAPTVEPQAPVAPRPLEPTPSARQVEPQLERAPRAEPTPAPPAPRPTAAVPPEPAPRPVPAELEPAAKVPVAPAAELAAEAPAEVAEVAHPKRQGKVVGFIDLAKIQPAAPKRPESRRHRGRDDELPDVKPTLHTDPKKALLRGDRGARNELSAAQLREREAGRYLRRRGPTTGPGAVRGTAPTGRGRRDTSSSPHSGNSVRIESPITVKELAEVLSVKSREVLQVAFRQLGFGAVNINSVLDDDTAQLLAGEFEVELDIVRQVEAEEALIEGLKQKRSDVEDEHLVPRAPAVAFLGHVDHGKTTLIDTIRKTQVAEGESGGITQHIGAYRVRTDAGHDLTIIDTPGHAAFTGMRARGARAVDVVVLVVAADAGVQPQSEEAYNHAKAAGTPVVVALNKIDRAEANPTRTMEQLSKLGLIPEEWGGSTAVMPVSGITGQGIQQLLERVFLESEILELKSHPRGPASGVVLEAEIEQGMGIVAHLLVQDGTLQRGDVILAGEGYGKVRSIHDDRGNTIDEAGPSMPVRVTGLSALPGIGEPFHVVGKLDQAKEVAEERSRKLRQSSLAERRRFDNASILQQVTGPQRATINIIVRADVQGSVEVLRDSLLDQQHAEVEVQVLQAGVGAVTENDVLLASASNALIVAFRVGVNAKARQTAEREGVEIRSYQVLYDVLSDVRDLMEGRLAPDLQEEIVGHAEVRRIFGSSRFGNIAGCFVLDGTIARDNKIRLLRDGKVVWRGELSSIRREKDDVREIREGFECGILLRNYSDLHEGDILEAFKVVEIKRSLSDKAR